MKVTISTNSKKFELKNQPTVKRVSEPAIPFSDSNFFWHQFVCFFCPMLYSSKVNIQTSCQPESNILQHFLLSHSQNCTIKCACLTSHYEGASSAQSRTEPTGLKCVCVCMYASVCLLSVGHPLMYDCVRLCLYVQT